MLKKKEKVQFECFKTHNSINSYFTLVRRKKGEGSLKRLKINKKRLKLPKKAHKTTSYPAVKAGLYHPREVLGGRKRRNLLRGPRSFLRADQEQK